MQDTQTRDTGWSFPPTFHCAGASTAMVTGPQQIKQALQLLFTTKRGERLNHPTYGCDLDQYLFEQVTAQLLIGIEYTISDAIHRYEPRIHSPVIAVAATEEAAFVLKIKITYTIVEGEQQDSLAFDLDLQAGGGF
ncbi:MAG: phage baseplate assembly protein W [Phenylobacterium sp.]|jgi:phage baseplate assembly protein W